MKKVFTPNLDKTEYTQALNTELSKWCLLMEEHWGQAPLLEPIVKPALLVEVSFDLGDFPHKGQTFIVHEDNWNRRNPAKVGRDIVKEIASHRNLCDRCGNHVPSLYTRASLSGRTFDSYNAKPYGDLLNTPADEVERKLFPVLSKRLDKIIAGELELTPVNDYQVKWVNREG